jgi:hypothetical protein
MIHLPLLLQTNKNTQLVLLSPLPGAPPPLQPGLSQAVYPWTARRLNLLPPTFLSKSAAPTSRRHHHFLGMVMRFPQLPLPAANCSFSEVWYTILHATIYVFSTRELSATLLQTSGETPSPRVGHSGALVSSVLFIWGGDTNTGGQEVPTEPQDDSLYLLNALLARTHAEGHLPAPSVSRAW